jgi:glycosyltransferase involved in cell wall biosynthesis
MEAAACGVAMVLTDIRGCREIGADGEHLLLVPAGDVNNLTYAVKRLLADTPLRRRLRAGARARALDHFDQRLIAQRSLAVYARPNRGSRLTAPSRSTGNGPIRAERPKPKVEQ